MSIHFSIAHTTRTYPRLPYEQIKNDLLGISYRLSLVFIGARRAQEFNRTNRRKTYVPNVLSFRLDETHGEIFITPTVAQKEARNWDMTINGYMGYLFIHAILHLKENRHGDTMEALEKKYCRRYNLV